MTDPNTGTGTGTDTDADTGTTSDALGGIAPLADKAKRFAKDRPYAAAALAGVVGLALLNTLRGKGGGS